jgi:hypothetical protein
MPLQRLTPFRLDARAGSSRLVTTWPLLRPTARPEATMVTGLSWTEGALRVDGKPYSRGPRPPARGRLRVPAREYWVLHVQ